MIRPYNELVCFHFQCAGQYVSTPLNIHLQMDQKMIIEGLKFYFTQIQPFLSIVTRKKAGEKLYKLIPPRLLSLRVYNNQHCYTLSLGPNFNK